MPDCEEKRKRKAPPIQTQPRFVIVRSSNGIDIRVKASRLAGSPILRARIHNPVSPAEPSIVLVDPVVERAEVISAALDIISRDKAIADVAYQCQLDVIKFLTTYEFTDELRFIRSSVHIAIHQSHSNFHPFTAFRIAIHLNDIDLCGRILAEMGPYRLTANRWGPEMFGEHMPGAGLFLVGAMSFEDMQSLPRAVYWALARAEMMAMNNSKAFGAEFVRLMKLRNAPSLSGISAIP